MSEPAARDVDGESKTGEMTVVYVVYLVVYKVVRIIPLYFPFIFESLTFSSSPFRLLGSQLTMPTEVSG